jgi:hypothetical protein
MTSASMQSAYQFTSTAIVESTSATKPRAFSVGRLAECLAGGDPQRASEVERGFPRAMSAR